MGAPRKAKAATDEELEGSKRGGGIGTRTATAIIKMGTSTLAGKWDGAEKLNLGNWEGKGAGRAGRPLPPSPAPPFPRRLRTPNSTETLHVISQALRAPARPRVRTVGASTD